MRVSGIMMKNMEEVLKCGLMDVHVAGAGKEVRKMNLDGLLR